MILVQVADAGQAYTTRAHFVHQAKAREHVIELLADAVAKRRDVRSVRVAFHGHSIPDRKNIAK